MSYTFTINSGANSVVIPVNTEDLTGYTLKLVLDKGGSAAPVEVTSGLVAGAGKVTLSIPAGQATTFVGEYTLVGTNTGVDHTLQTGRIRLRATADPDGNTETVIATSDASGLLMRTVQEKFREDFTGTAVDTNFWDVTPGPGMTVAVTGSELRIDSGTTANSVTTLRSKKSWSGAYRVMFLSAATLLSQRIINQEFELRVVNAAGTSFAGWFFSGTVATTHLLRAGNGGSSLADTSVSSAATTAGPGIFEIENFIDETYFHSRTADSSNTRTTSNVRNRQIPDPNEEMFIEIRVKNLATAPASTTRLSLDAVLVQDISELTTEITGGRGGGASSQSIPVVWNGSQNVNVANNPVLSVVGLETNAITATALTAGNTYTQTGQDWSATVNTRPTRARVTVMHTAGTNHGTLSLQESLDNSVWRTTWQCPIPSDGLYHTFDVPMHLRYYRWVFLNGATTQTAFYLGATYVRGDGAADIGKNLAFPLTAAAGASVANGAQFVGPTIDVGGNHSWDKVRAMMGSDQATQLLVQQSMDATTWSNVTTTGVSAAGFSFVEVPVYTRYIRIISGSMPAAATIRVVATLVSL